MSRSQATSILDLSGNGSCPFGKLTKARYCQFKATEETIYGLLCHFWIGRSIYMRTITGIVRFCNSWKWCILELTAVYPVPLPAEWWLRPRDVRKVCCLGYHDHRSGKPLNAVWSKYTQCSTPSPCILRCSLYRFLSISLFFSSTVIFLNSNSGRREHEGKELHSTICPDMLCAASD